jgi:2-C-methyl-D-erythritol 4-phosphate cytidylyltransferase
MNISVIIPSGGSGKRFGSEIPKQFLDLDSIPIIVKTLLVFDSVKEINSILVPNIKEYNYLLESYISKYSFNKQIKIINGGLTRQDSVYNALKTAEVQNSDLVLIHDAVRPLVSINLINKIIDAAVMYGAVVPVTNPKDTIKQVDNNGFVDITINRSFLKNVQTPQGFDRKILFEAYNKAFSDGFWGTDDASVVEHFGNSVKTIEGEETNFKITSKVDLELAKV